MLISPNNVVPQLQVDNVTGEVVLPIDQVAGSAVLAELNAATGNIYKIPASDTFQGIAILMVGGTGAGLVQIVDASSVVLHSVEVTVGGIQANPYIVSVTDTGGGSGNQLSVTATGGATVLSAVVAGYV